MVSSYFVVFANCLLFTVQRCTVLLYWNFLDRNWLHVNYDFYCDVISSSFWTCSWNYASEVRTVSECLWHTYSLLYYYWVMSCCKVESAKTYTGLSNIHIPYCTYGSKCIKLLIDWNNNLTLNKLIYLSMCQIAILVG